MLILTNTYPGQVLTDATNYPQGKARNEVVEGDGTGTPYEQQLVNDWFGGEQALLRMAGITPSGNPDTAIASDRQDARDKLYGPDWARYNVTGEISGTDYFDLAAVVSGRGTWTLVPENNGHKVRFPREGVYFVSFSVTVNSSDIAARAAVSVRAVGAGLNSLYAQNERASTDPFEHMLLSASGIYICTDPNTQFLWLDSTDGFTLEQLGNHPGSLAVCRLGTTFQP